MPVVAKGACHFTEAVPSIHSAGFLRLVYHHFNPTSTDSSCHVNIISLYRRCPLFPIVLLLVYSSFPFRHSAFPLKWSLLTHLPALLFPLGITLPGQCGSLCPCLVFILNIWPSGILCTSFLLLYCIILFFTLLDDILYSLGGISSWLRAHHLTKPLIVTVVGLFILKQQKYLAKALQDSI